VDPATEPEELGTGDGLRLWTGPDPFGDDRWRPPERLLSALEPPRRGETENAFMFEVVTVAEDGGMVGSLRNFSMSLFIMAKVQIRGGGEFVVGPVLSCPILSCPVLTSPAYKLRWQRVRKRKRSELEERKGEGAPFFLCVQCSSKVRVVSVQEEQSIE